MEVVLNPGCIVRLRDRFWALLPHEDPPVIALRPLTGAMDETLLLHASLTDRLAYSLPEERLQPAVFPLPQTADLSDAAGARLLWQAARLTLREGASPSRRKSAEPTLFHAFRHPARLFELWPPQYAKEKLFICQSAY